VPCGNGLRIGRPLAAQRFGGKPRRCRGHADYRFLRGTGCRIRIYVHRPERPIWGELRRAVGGNYVYESAKRDDCEADYSRSLPARNEDGDAADHAGYDGGEIGLADGSNQRSGFTILELLLAMAVFLVICGAMFSLLQLSQQRYSSETQLSGTFQEARLAMDQIARDVSDAGYPSTGMYSTIPTTNTFLYAVGPVAWSTTYPTSPCSLGITCPPTPGDFDLILETTIGSTVSWIRYQLVGTTLYRGSVAKNGTDPVGATSATGVMVPFLVNVMNDVSSTQIAQITASYPGMFPSGPVPIFQYSCDTPAGVVSCATAGAYNSVLNVRDVDITLIVMTQLPDAQTQQIKLIELNGRGHRLNPSK